MSDGSREAPSPKKANQLLRRARELRSWQAIELSLATPSISERASNESIIYQADAARLIGELDLFARYVRQGAELALTLHSQKRYHEVLEVFQRAPRSWQHEPQIQRLARDFFKPLPSPD
jgi:hypothetical protein